MPHKIWQHFCRSSGLVVQAGRKTCPYCGASGQYAGWGYSRLERMSSYERKTGLRAIGPHRPLADAVFAPLLRPCEICDAKGWLDIHDGEACCRCPACEGTMVLLRVGEETFKAARRRVLKMFPAAGVRDVLR